VTIRGVWAPTQGNIDRAAAKAPRRAGAVSAVGSATVNDSMRVGRHEDQKTWEIDECETRLFYDTSGRRKV
jgi:hypothetical protein